MAFSETTKAVNTAKKRGVVTEINERLAALKKKDGDGKGGVPVQQELIEDARQTKKLPAKLRNLLAPLCEAEQLSGSNRLRANELLEEITAEMVKLEIPRIALPNGGSVICTTKTKGRYEAPKEPKKKKATEDDFDENARIAVYE